MSNTPTIQTTLVFTPSPEVERAMNEIVRKTPTDQSPEYGLLGYGVLWYIDGVQQPPIDLGPEQMRFTIGAPTGSRVRLAVAARNADGVYSRGEFFEFTANGVALPSPPGPVDMAESQVVPENATNLTIQGHTEAAARLKKEPANLHLMVSGHDQLKDGARGVICGFEEADGERVLTALFDASMHKPDASPQITHYFMPGAGCTATVVAASGERVSLEEYFQINDPSGPKQPQRQDESHKLQLAQ